MTYTRLFCTIGLIVASLYDLVVVSIGGVDISISRWFQTMGFSAPFQIFVLGYLAGHFWGFMPYKYKLFMVRSRDNYDKYTCYVIAGHEPSYQVFKRAVNETDEIDITPIKPIIL